MVISREVFHASCNTRGAASTLTARCTPVGSVRCVPSIMSSRTNAAAHGRARERADKLRNVHFADVLFIFLLLSNDKFLLLWLLLSLSLNEHTARSNTGNFDCV